MSEKEAPRDIDPPEVYSIDYLEMSDGAKLRYLYYHPENPKGKVYLLPGMNTLVLSWIKVLEGLAELNFRVDYVESREKTTAILPEGKVINIVTRERMLLDNVESLDLLGLTDDYIALGSSLGSTTFIHNMADKKISPKHVVLVGPSMVFNPPWGFRMILKVINKWFYDKIGKRVAIWILLRSYTDPSKDIKQFEKYKLALQIADFNKLKSCAQNWQGNRVHDDLPRIDGNLSKCHLIGASKDKLHPDEETKFIADQIDQADFVDLETNTAAHDQPIIDYIASL